MWRFLFFFFLVPGLLQAQVINEFVANHTGSDIYEFVEIYGSPNQDYSDLTVLALDGDSNTNPGEIVYVQNLTSTDGNGFWYTGHFSNNLSNDNLTILLVRNFSGALGDDTDANNDGSFDSPPWSEIVDAIGIGDSSAGVDYATIVLEPNYDGISFTVAGASRVPDGQNEGSINDWVRNDFSGYGLGCLLGGLDVNEAVNTPGEPNTVESVLFENVMISEFVADHAGDDTAEFIEIFGCPGFDYSQYWLLVLESDQAENPGQVDLAINCGTANNGGFWVSDLMSDQLENGNLSLLLVTQFTGAVSDDLDTNDDGNFDAEPWTQLLDDVALNTSPNGVFYGNTTLSNSLGGASRIPYGIDTDSPDDWTINDFDGEGLSGFDGNLERGEALHTPGKVNRVGVTDIYQNVNLSSAETLRATLNDAIQDHIRFPYTSSTGTDTWDILELAQEDPFNPANAIMIYRNNSLVKFGGGSGPYNREHTWPKSYGFPDDDFFMAPYTDCHHLFLADSGYNSTRGNMPYGDCSQSCSERVTTETNGIGGQGGEFPGDSNWFNGSGLGTWQVWNHRKGDIARAIFYMDIRYEGETHNVRAFPELDLIVTDQENLIQVADGVTSYMGRLSTLLRWHQEDPVDEEELRRNEIVASFQGNRNPFVDHPEWVSCLYDVCENDPTCYINHLDTWLNGESSQCSGLNEITILDFIGMIAQTCACE